MTHDLRCGHYETRSIRNALKTRYSKWLVQISWCVQCGEQWQLIWEDWGITKQPRSDEGK